MNWKSLGTKLDEQIFGIALRPSLMTDFALAQSADGSPSLLAQACANQLRNVHGHNLGFIYVTAPLAGALQEIVGILKDRSSIKDWFGTVGFGICSTETEYFGRPAIVALTARLAKDSYRMVGPLSDPSESLLEVDEQFAAAFGVVHGDPRNPRIAEIVATLAKDNGAFLVGGLTASDTSFPQSVGRIVDSGVSGVLFDSGVEVAVGLTQGCYPIGLMHEVTQQDGNILVTLDNRAALEVLCEDLGVAEGVDPRPWLANIHAALPISGSDTGDYLVRNLMGIGLSEGLIGIAHEIAVGDRMMFVRRDAENAAKDLERMLEDLKSRIAVRPKAGLYFSCVARGPYLFKDETHELSAIRRAFGDIPLAGFFGNGEISNDRVYGYTGVLTLFL